MVIVQIEATVFARPLGHIPDIYLCNHSSSDRLRFIQRRGLFLGQCTFLLEYFRLKTCYMLHAGL